MNTYILIYFNAAALACIAEAAGAEAGRNGQIITQEQITGYAKVLGNNAYKIHDRIVMKLECEEIPAPYVEFAEAIYESNTKGNPLRVVKAVKRDLKVAEIAYIADSAKYPYMKIMRSNAKAEEVRDPNATVQ
jgi:hypothetical protein